MTALEALIQFQKRVEWMRTDQSFKPPEGRASASSVFCWLVKEATEIFLTGSYRP